jgi:hypothetical protein
MPILVLHLHAIHMLFALPLLSYAQDHVKIHELNVIHFSYFSRILLLLRPRPLYPPFSWIAPELLPLTIFCLSDFFYAPISGLNHVDKGAALLVIVRTAYRECQEGAPVLVRIEHQASCYGRRAQLVVTVL